MMKWILCFLYCLPLFAEIIETKNFRDILTHLKSHPLILLDLDDTLIIPTQALGTDAWFCHQYTNYQKQMSKQEALRKALMEWEGVRQITQVKLVEEEIDQIIDKMQKENLVVMGLTTQGLTLSCCTPSQLKSLGIDLSKTAPSKTSHYFINHDEGVLYKDGILFTGGSPKGPALIQLLESLNYKPSSIVFINDKKTHLEDVEKSVLAKGIAFIGLRYSYCDSRVAAFNPEITEIQWKSSSFDHILSDLEAENILRNPLKKAM